MRSTDAVTATLGSCSHHVPAEAISCVQETQAMGSTADAGTQCVGTRNVSNATQTSEQPFCSSGSQTDRVPPGAVPGEAVPTEKRLARSEAVLAHEASVAALKENQERLREEHQDRLELLRVTLELLERRYRMELEAVRARNKLEEELLLRQTLSLERLIRQHERSLNL